MSNDNPLKKCTKCKEWKAREQFSKDRSRGDGLHASCKPCNQAQSQHYYVNHQPQVLARTARYQQAHPEGNRAASKKWRAKNPEKAHQSVNRWSTEHPEE